MIDLSGVRPLGLSQAHYDLDAVVAGLRATATSWVPSHFRNGKRLGDELRLANIRGDKPRKQGSCVIALEGERAGDWIDFDDNQGGGPLSTLEHATGLTGRALIEYAADLAGSTPVNGASHPIAEALTKEQRAENIARVRQVLLIVRLGEAEVGHPDRAGGIQQQVGRLDVAVLDPLSMGILQGVGHLCADACDALPVDPRFIPSRV